MAVFYKNRALYAKFLNAKLDLIELDMKIWSLKAGFNPDQPRVPAGSSDGGQWTDGGGSGGGHNVEDSVVGDSPHLRVMPVSDSTPLVDIDKALNIFRNSPGLGTGGDCAQQVRRALNRAGFDVGRPKNSNHAKDYGEPLKEAGFEEVSKWNKYGSLDKDGYVPGFKPRKGDVAIIKPALGGSPSGHMQIYDGIRWYPRFPRDEFWPGRHYREDKPSYVIYRHTGR